MTLRTISRSNLSLIAAVTAALTLAGCASQVPLEEKKPAPVASAAAPAAGPSAAEIAAREIAAAKAELAKVKPSIYFDFDKFEIKPEFQGTIAAYAKYMKIDSKARLIIEGNADERGTTEYNLALGQKRAEAVRRALGVSGVAENRVEAISNGEEKPKAKGSNEAAWAENRRADLVVK